MPRQNATTTKKHNRNKSIHGCTMTINKIHIKWTVKRSHSFFHSHRTAKLQQEFGDILVAPLGIQDLLYVDDTLLINYRSEHIQKHMDAIISTGAEYGLEINWQKVDMMGVRCHPIVSNMSGTHIDQKMSLQYLGASISVDGCIQSEVNRRIGMATSDFKMINVLWTHTSITNHEKYKIYMACIISKLLYGLQTAWLTKAQRTKLDGFHARWVRTIVGVLPSYWSRISNLEVLSYVRGQQLSGLLLELQLGLFGKIFRRDQNDPLRQVVFRSNSSDLVIDTKRRRRGRPKLSWAVEVRKKAVQVSGTTRLQDAMGKAYGWKMQVKKFCWSQ